MSDLERSALLTDLYQLTMLQGYVEHNMEQEAVFEFFPRKLPDSRGFLVAAGLAQTLDFLENLQFSPQELDYLAADGRFGRDFIDYLAKLRFTGDVHALPEGTPCFPNEPLLRITAPLPQAQLVESRVINLLHFQTLIASKAARCYLAAPDKLLVDFGMRRAHGGEAGLLAARASYLTGFAGSATVLAGQRFNIPTYGTMAHSFIQAHDTEEEAFERFAKANPGAVILLIDTYDTEEGARKVVELAPRLQAQGISVTGVRIDSGNLAEHAAQVRRILDEAGLTGVTIFASGSVDEYLIQDFTAAAVPVDGYGIGTHLDTSADAPYLDCAYKLEEYAGQARRKRSEGKATWPGRKQVYRHYDRSGTMTGDTLTVEADTQEGEPLVEQVMASGQRLRPAPALTNLREEALGRLGWLPEHLQRLETAPPYPVEIAPALHELAAEVDAWRDR